LISLSPQAWLGLGALAGIIACIWIYPKFVILLDQRACRKQKRIFQKDLYPARGGEEVRFLLIGDQGSGDKYQRAVSQASFATAEALGAEFTLFLGDNFIQDGVQGLDDPQFKIKFEEMYPHQMPFYAILGNHDLRNAWPSLIDYTAISERWRMPETDYSFQAGPVSFFAFNSTCTICSAWPLYQKVDTPWKVAFGHHPVISSGRHGQMTGLERFVIRKSGVDFLFAGHNHLLEHVQYKGMEQILSGGGGSPLPQTKLTPSPHTRFLLESHGYAWARFSATEAEFKFFNEKGEELYSYLKQK